MHGSITRRALFASALLCALLTVDSVARAGAWTTPEGVLWLKVAWFRLDSDRLFVDSLREGVFCAEENRFLEEGDRGPYDCNLEGGGGLRTDQVFLEFAFGIHKRIDFRLQLPIILAGEFVSDGTPATRRGVGDLRLTTQVLIVDSPVVVAANMEVKAPTGFFTADAVGVPLGEGQWDVAFRGLISGSLLGGRLWMGAEVGYRIRTPNDELGFTGDGLNLGDEILVVAEGGGRPIDGLYLSLRGELLYGFASKDDIFELPGRRVAYIQPGIAISPFAFAGDSFREWTDLSLEFGVRIPVWGRNWPADPIYFLGLSKSIRLFEPYSG
ncbi:MAG: hypothetical protein AAGE52_21585 [Myxococcota bacterium]